MNDKSKVAVAESAVAIQYYYIVIRLWMFFMESPGTQRRITLTTMKEKISDRYSLADCQRMADQMISDYRSINYHINHSDLHCDWYVSGKAD